MNICVLSTHLAFDTLYWINNDSNSSLRQSLKALLCVDVNTWQPAAEARMGVIPANDHFRPTTNNNMHESNAAMSDNCVLDLNIFS